MVKNFENRIDYVDIQAYGVGKVKIEDENTPERCQKVIEIDGLEGEQMLACSNPNARVF